MDLTATAVPHIQVQAPKISGMPANSLQEPPLSTRNKHGGFTSACPLHLPPGDTLLQVGLLAVWVADMPLVGCVE
jgi:hypothetical protein